MHIWNTQNTETIRVVRTLHTNCITNVQFSKDAKFLVTVGMDKQFSIQITDWENEVVLAFRNTGEHNIFDVQFNPLNRYEVSTSGWQHLAVWALQGKNLMRKQYINAYVQSKHGKQCSIVCFAYLTYQMNQLLSTNIVGGNNFGDIVLIIEDKYIQAKEKAHQKMISCIRVSNAFAESIIIITAGEDEKIKVWDTAFELLVEIEIRKMKFYTHIPKPKKNEEQKNFSAQSLDVYFCHESAPGAAHDTNTQDKKDAQEKSNDPPQLPREAHFKLLVGTRSGEIMEVQIPASLTFDAKKLGAGQDANQLLPQQQKYAQQEQMQHLHVTSPNSKLPILDVKLYLRFHSSQIATQSANKAILTETSVNKKVSPARAPPIAARSAVTRAPSLSRSP